MDQPGCEPESLRMQADALTLAQFLSLSALIAATVEYAEIIKRRATRRLEAALRQESADVGLRGLVRVFLAEESVPDPAAGEAR